MHPAAAFIFACAANFLLLFFLSPCDPHGLPFATAHRPCSDEALFIENTTAHVERFRVSMYRFTTVVPIFIGTVLPRLSVPRLSETSIIQTQFRTWSLCKKLVFSLKSQTLRLSRVHVFVCHTYMFNVGTQWYVIVYRVKCNGLQTRPSYIFSCYNSMYIARKVSLIWIIRTISLIRTAYKTPLPKGVRITGVGLYIW